jgi:5-methylcytosine-specific restriction protein A
MPDAPPTHRPHGVTPWQGRADTRPGARQRGYDADWQAVRAQAMQRDGNRCTRCSSTDRLNVHHVKTVREAPALRLVLGNLQTLCASCHSAHTSREHSWNRAR